MINQTQMKFIVERAYIPEHIPQYVMAVSDAEPFLLQDFVLYHKKGQLIFIGYPLKHPFDEKRMSDVLEDSIRDFQPKTISLIASTPPVQFKDWMVTSSDHYYRLDLSTFSISQKTRNMLSRAERELSLIKIREIRKEHKQLIKEFLRSHLVDEAMKSIFGKVGEYLSSTTTAWVFEARKGKGELVAFDIAEFGAEEYAFYMFNFTSDSHYVPGASDLLLYEIIKVAKAENKRYINLGLGINPGVTFFKKKWGGVPFLNYVYCLYQPSRLEAMGRLIGKL